VFNKPISIVPFYDREGNIKHVNIREHIFQLTSYDVRVM